MAAYKLQSGSIHLTIIIGLVVVVLGATAAAFIFSINNSSNDSNSEAKATVVSEPKPALQDIYSYYLAQINNSSSRDVIQKLVDDGRVESGFRVSSSVDPLLCSNEDKPSSVSISLLNKSSSTATLNVIKVYSNSFSSDSSMKATLKARDDGGWKLSEISCL